MSLPDDITSNTGISQDKPKKPGTFQRGDARINRKGRPKTLDKLRKLAVEVMAEENPQGISRITAMLRAMSISDNPADRKLLLEYTYGKVKNEVDITSNKIIIKLLEDDDA